MFTHMCVYACNEHKEFSLYTYLLAIMRIYVVAHNPIPLPPPPPPPQDPTMTVDIVTQILNSIPRDEWEKVMGGSGLYNNVILRPLLKEIQRRYSTDAEKNCACADYYVNCHPMAQWTHLNRILYWNKEFGAARESKSFTCISTGK